jgi:hypothetical protein
MKVPFSGRRKSYSSYDVNGASQFKLQHNRPTDFFYGSIRTGGASFPWF